MTAPALPSRAVDLLACPVCGAGLTADAPSLRCATGHVFDRARQGHVTLLPPTEVAVLDRPAISRHLETVAAAHAPFDMHLLGTGTFTPVSEVVFVAVARGIGNCELLANDVRDGPLSRELSYPYHPHVTVAHDVPPDMLELAYSGLSDLSAEFRVDFFTEFEQTAGGAWAVARKYPLTGPPR